MRWIPKLAKTTDFEVYVQYHNSIDHLNCISFLHQFSNIVLRKMDCSKAVKVLVWETVWLLG